MHKARELALLVSILISAVSSPIAHAAEAGSSPRTTAASTSDVRPAGTEAPLPRVAVLKVRPSGTVDPKEVEGLTAFVQIEAARRPGVEIIGQSDVRAVLGFEAERQMLGCDQDASCLAEIAGALGVEYVLTTEVSRVGETWLLAMNLLETRGARGVARTSRRLDGSDGLLNASSSALSEVLAAVARPAAEASGRGALAWTLAGTGGAALLGGGVMYAGAWSTFRRWEDDRAHDRLTVSPDEQRLAQDVLAPVGLGLVGTGAALLVASFLLPEGAPATPSVAVAEDAALLTLTLRVP